MRPTSRFLHGLTAILALHAVAAASGPQVQVFDVTTYGATPDDDTNDDRIPIQTAINTATAWNGPAEVYFPPGEYRCSAVQDYIFAGNDITLAVSGASDLSLNGYGAATIVSTDPFAFFVAVFGSTDVEVVGLEFIHDPLPFTQGTVVDVVDSQSFDVDLDPGYPLPTGPEFQRLWTLLATGRASIFFTDANANFIPGAPVANYILSNPTGPVSGHPRRFHFTMQYPQPIVAGDRFLYTMRTNITHAVGFLSCDGCEMRDLTVYSSDCFAYMYRGCENVVIERCNVLPAPATAGRTAADWSTDGDCVNGSGGRSPAYVSDCLFVRAFDDGFNVYSASQEVMMETNEDGYEVVSVPSLLYQDVQVGDQVQILDGVSRLLQGTATVHAVSAPYQVTYQGNTVTWVDLTLPGETSVSVGEDLVNTAQASPGTVVSNVNFEHLRGGVFAHGAGTTFLNCTLRDMTSGLMLDAIVDGPVSSGILVENPVFDNVGFCGPGTEPHGNAIIWARQSENFHITNPQILNGPWQEAIHLEHSTDFLIDQASISNTAVGQPGYQVKIYNSSIGTIRYSSVTGGMPVGGPYDEQASTVTRIGNNWD